MNDLNNAVDSSDVNASNSTDATDVSASSIASAVESVASAARVVRKGRPLDPNGRLGQARAIYANATDKTRKNLIAEFTSKIAGVSKPVASAYYHQIVKSQKA